MSWILGVDEAGRGPLAGPVAVGVVRTPIDFDFASVFPKLNDSKKLSEKRREEIFEEVEKQVALGMLTYCVKSVPAATIDRAGIAPSVRKSVEVGIRTLAPTPKDVHVYLDGLLHAPEGYSQETIEGGDALIPAIMLASVVAKVTRDRYMKKLALVHPLYGFEQHKGYGTRAHIAAIQTHGFSSEHRKSFCTRICK